MKKYNEIILASTSPRRRKLFGATGIEHRIEASDYEEDMTLEMPPEELVQFLARGKAYEVASRFPDAIVIGADTICAFDGKVYGKPKTQEEAAEMLRSFSGRQLQAVTGVSIMIHSIGYIKTFYESATIHMREIPEAFIWAYIDTGIPMDKAGAFGVQDFASRLIEKIEGDYLGVIGLPIHRVISELLEIDPEILESEIAG